MTFGMIMGQGHYNRIHNYVNFIHKRIYLFFYFYATNLRKCRYLVLVIIRGKFGINLPSSLLKFWNLSSVTRDISKCQKFNEVIFPQISRINMWFLVNHMWKALKEHTRVRITQKKQPININKFNKQNSITPTLQ